MAGAWVIGALWLNFFRKKSISVRVDPKQTNKQTIKETEDFFFLIQLKVISNMKA